MRNPILSPAIQALQQGAIIAYPTEAVYGLGCDPDNEAAVMRLLALKQRRVNQGVILIAASMAQIESYILPIPSNAMQQVLATWPGPVTWVFPASARVPTWVRGDHATIALRVTAHPIAHALCAEFGRPIVSTSANVHQQSPAVSSAEINSLFPHGIDYIVPGNLGKLAKPTAIRHAITGEILR